MKPILACRCNRHDTPYLAGDIIVDARSCGGNVINWLILLLLALKRKRVILKADVCFEPSCRMHARIVQIQYVTICTGEPLSAAHCTNKALQCRADRT